ncbi:MAG: putative Ig domain-containing protein [Syntrophorhabdaceae bacterium]|nr:putative Ig domain-containing protein [Syntrophorhabdaceae bacterium]
MFVAILLMLVASIVTAGIAVIGSLTKRTKIAEMNSIIDAGIKSVISYAATNHRLPTTAEIAAIMKRSNDAWGNQTVYVVDNNLTSIPAGSTDSICGRKTANLTVRNCTNAGCTAYTDISNIAFLILSGGENVNNQTAGTQAVTGPTVINVYSVGINVDNYAGDLSGARAEPYDDIVKWVTLEELKNTIGCYGTAQGRFKILNNELPGACVGQSYKATMYSDGGVLPYSDWTTTALPAGLSMDLITGAISGTSTGPAQVHNITFSRNDNDGNTAQKMLKLIVEDCPLGSWNFDDPVNPGGTIATGPGGSIASVAGVSGGALYFTGVASLTPYNQGINNSVFSFEYNQPFSIVMWVKLTKLPTAAPTSPIYPLVSKGGAGPNYTGYYFEIHSSAYSQPAVGYNRLAFQLTNQLNGGAGPMIWVYNTTPISTLNTWYHIAAAYSGNGLASGAKVYVSGGSTNATYRDNLANGSIVNTQPLRFGDYGQNYYNSVVMDGIQIYNKVVQQLRVIKAGTGSGTVASSLFFRSPERINCGSICEAYYPNGTIVALGAAANTGSTFTGWSGGGCSGTGTCLVTLTADTDVTATFTNP